MESLYQNCVTEFDLELFDQETTANRAGLPTPCPVARKHGLARVKHQIINTNLVVRKAKGTFALLEKTKNDLEETRIELEETKKLLFDKNEDHKVICNERNTYFNRTLEYSNELQTLKEQMKALEESNYEVQLKERVIQGYSDQVKGLQTEMENIEAARKRSERESSFAVARANKEKYWAEKKLAKVLGYVYPLIKKPERWLQTLMKKYYPNKKFESSNPDVSEHTSDVNNVSMSPLISEQKEDCEKMQKSSDVTEVIKDIDSSMLNRNNSLDFEFIGSVDTGRGSSLAFSDGDKSFHSPDYYMADSPLSAVPNVCDICSVAKSDVSTSPIHETFDVADSSVTNTYSTSMQKRDVSTSPMSLERLDIATDTAEISNDKCTHRSQANKITSPVKQFVNLECHNQEILTKSSINRMEKPVNAVDNRESESDYVSISNKKTPEILVLLPDKTTSDTEESVNNNIRVAEPADNLTTIEPVFKGNTETNNFDISDKETLSKLPDDMNKVIINNVNIIAKSVENLSDIEEDDETTAINNINFVNKEISTTPVMLPIPDDMASDTDERLNNVNQKGGEDEDSARIPAIEYDEFVKNDINVLSKELSKPAGNLHNIIPNTELDIYKGTLNEKECLNLNNSNNFSNDISADSEIQLIFDKMQLRLQAITPIPPTPPRRRMQSPHLIHNDLNQRSGQEPTRYLDKELNRFKDAFKQVLDSFQFSRDVFEKMPETYSEDVHNQALIRNLVSYARNDYRREKTPELNSCNDTDMQLITQDGVQNSASGLNTKVLYDNTYSHDEGSTVNDDDDMPQQDWESDDLYHIPRTESSNNEKEGMCKINDEIPNLIEKTIIVTKNKVIESESAASLNNKSPNNSIDSIEYKQVTHKYTQEIFSNNVLESSNNTEASVVNLNINSSLSTLNNLVNVNEPSTSDKDINILQQNLESEDVDHHITNKETRTCEKITPNKDLTNQITKKKKLTKLQKRRLQLMPKSKIREELLRPAKKALFKPSPIITVLKKKVTESDTAATLNDKSVYENAVKVMSALKSNNIPLNREPSVLVEDYLVPITKNDLQSTPQNDKNKNDTENVLKSHLPTEVSSEINNKKKNLLFELENLAGTTENHQDKKEQSKRIFGDKSELVACKKKRTTYSSEPVTYNGIQRSKRKKASNTCNQSSGKNEMDRNVGKSESVACQRLLRGSKSFDESDNETLSTIRNNESILFIATNKTKRRRNSISESPPRKSSNCNKQIELPDNNNHIRTGNEEDDDSKLINIKKQTISTRHSVDSNQIAKTTVDQNSRTAYRQDSGDKFSDNPIEERRNQIIHEVNDGPVSPPQRILRSSNVQHKTENVFRAESIFAVTNTECNPERHPKKMNQVLGSEQDDNTELLTSPNKNSRIAHNSPSEGNNKELNNLCLSESVIQSNHETTVSYADLDLFINEETCEQNIMTQEQIDTKEETLNFNSNNILCRMIEKYGINQIKVPKKVPDAKANEICNKLETSIFHIAALPNDQCPGPMKRLVTEIRSLKPKHFIVGLLKFLKDPQRKLELLSKAQSQQQAPPMTKKEQVLLYVVDELGNYSDYRGIVNKILINIEYVLFALNKTPEFEVVESLSHFYALLCRYYQKMSQLRLFIVNAIYCLQFKSIILIKNCLDVWMFILPMGHMGLAKTSLVTCLVYLLHFYKCEDKSQNAFEMRTILKWKYNYDLTDWNETKILDMFRTAITELGGNPLETKMLRLALIILAKRYGPKWCHKYIVKNMLLPIIEREMSPEVTKLFSVSILGALLKPYPNDMKVHCEMMTDYLLELLDQTQSQNMQEAIMTSLLCLNRYHDRVIRFLLRWNPKQVSPEFNAVFKDYVKSKPVKTWKSKVSQIL